MAASRKSLTSLRKYNTPGKIQDYLNSLDFNFSKKGPAVKSPLHVMKTGSAHCMEGAILGAYLLSLQGFPPLVLHLEATKHDFDHVIAPFRQGGLWGALSKTNHAVLRYREPVYRSIRELVMSYFHEYFMNSDGEKTLRHYSRPLDLSIFGRGWEMHDGDLVHMDEKLDEIKHYDIMPKAMEKKLRPAEMIERKAGKIVEKKRR